MFRGATFADLEKLGPPFVMVQATDLANGAAFPFIQSQFDLICSNLSSYPLARAVAASNGFPILFTPIVLKNYRDDCAAKEPAWVTRGMADPDPLSRQRQQAKLARSYLRDPLVAREFAPAIIHEYAFVTSVQSPAARLTAAFQAQAREFLSASGG